MLKNFWRSLWIQAPAAAQQLGLAKEHHDIARRHAKVAAAWAPHLAASKALILEFAEGCEKHEQVLVIGAGDCLDVPVAELADLFQRVILADIVVSRTARAWAKRRPGRVLCENWDASGALATLAAVKDSVTAGEAPGIFARADPGPPPGGASDYIVSASCISQLGLVPGHSLPASAKDQDLPERCARTAAKRHLAWLQEQEGVRLLIADAARLDIGRDGRQLKKETLHERFGLPKPDRVWRWDLAPIPEWAPDFHRVHEVGAWRFGA